MNTIGLRASNTEVVFAVFDTDNISIVNVDTISIPVAFTVPLGLKYLRSNLLDVLKEYNINSAGIRITESNAKNMQIARIQIEGVIQEAFASSGIKSYYTGQISSISRRLKIERASFKQIVDGRNDLDIAEWDDFTKNQREAVLCSIGAENV